MELLLLFGVGLSTGLSGAMIPGPLFLYTVSEAFREGQLAGLKVALGHLLLEGAFATVAVVGLRHLLASEGFRATVEWVGGAGLALMGCLMLAKLKRFSLAQRSDVAFRWGPVAGGAFFSLASPGFLLWWATIGTPVFLQGALLGAAGVAMVGLGHAAADLGWSWFVAFSVERGRPYCSDATYRLIMALIALSLIGLGVGLPLTHGHLY